VWSSLEECWWEFFTQQYGRWGIGCEVGNDVITQNACQVIHDLPRCALQQSPLNEIICSASKANDVRLCSTPVSYNTCHRQQATVTPPTGNAHKINAIYATGSKQWTLTSRSSCFSLNRLWAGVSMSSNSLLASSSSPSVPLLPPAPSEPEPSASPLWASAWELSLSSRVASCALAAASASSRLRFPFFLQHREEECKPCETLC